VLNVTAITHRRNPVYPTIIVGKPPQEDYYLGKATERVFLPLLKILIPDIVDFDLPMFGVFHSCAFVKIRKEYPFHARKVMNAIWGAGQMAWTKIIVVVDEDVDVHSVDEVMFRVAGNVDPKRDVRWWMGRWIFWTMPRRMRGRGARWGSTRRGNGRGRAWCGIGRRKSGWMRRRLRR